jgi:hypothetical protein
MRVAALKGEGLVAMNARGPIDLVVVGRGDERPAAQGAAPLDPAPRSAGVGLAGRRRRRVPGWWGAGPGPYRDGRASYDPVGTPHRLDESDQDGLPQQAASGPLSEAV